MIDYGDIDYRNPDYASMLRKRMAALRHLREHPQDVPLLKQHYRAHPADFISDWGVTFEPRNAERGLPSYIPFILFPKQREWVDWVIGRWKAQTPGLCEKSRDMGISWLATSLACTLCLFYDGVAIGFGSRVVDLVDKIGTMKPLLPKARVFMQHIPEEFRGGWIDWRDAPYMRLAFPETGSIIMGEGGDQIGRGDRASIYVIDEAAYLERPESIEHSLSQTTNCRIDMSSVNGMNNPFAKKRHEGKVDVFVFDWRDDPRKDQSWYDALPLPTDQFIERADGSRVYGKGLDPVTIAQEVDRDYQASVHGIVIPGPWVRAAIGALEKLGLKATGEVGLALDVADEGRDRNAVCGGKGVEISVAEEWSGKGSDTFQTVQRAFDLADEAGAKGFRYDADGMGALVRGDARVINERRQASGARPQIVVGFRSSDAVLDPEGIVEGTIGSAGDKGRTNQDYFANRKAQGWWALRKRFQRTYRWITDGVACDPNEIVSISPKLKNLHKLTMELSQPTYGQNGVGKMLINKQPDGMPSPNLADGVMMRFAPNEIPTMNLTADMVSQIVASGRRRR